MDSLTIGSDQIEWLREKGRKYQAAAAYRQTEEYQKRHGKPVRGITQAKEPAQ